jgi:hypothetical protein
MATPIKNLSQVFIQKYGLSIDTNKLIEIYISIYESDGGIKDAEKYKFMNELFECLFGNDFDTLITIVKVHTINSYFTKNSKIEMIEENRILNDQISILAKEIEELKETIQELRDNYWDLKHTK